MRVEQRIGRIDRLGQTHPAIRIVNLHYEGTVETDVYGVLRNRIGLFEAVVGPLQPILAQLPRTIAGAVLTGRGRRGETVRSGVPEDHASVAEAIERQVREAATGGFDIDATVDTDVSMPARPSSPVAMEDLDRVIGSPDLMPPGTDVQPLGQREYGLLAPGMTERLRVTTNPAYYEEHSESVELWSPGNPLFTPPEFAAKSEDDEFPPGTTLKGCWRVERGALRAPRSAHGRPTRRLRPREGLAAIDPVEIGGCRSDQPYDKFPVADDSDGLFHDLAGQSGSDRLAKGGAIDEGSGRNVDALQTSRGPPRGFMRDSVPRHKSPLPWTEVHQSAGRRLRRSTICTASPTTTASTSRISCVSGGSRADRRPRRANRPNPPPRHGGPEPLRARDRRG